MGLRGRGKGVCFAGMLMSMRMVWMHICVS